jgi:hypothetical protein
VNVSLILSSYGDLDIWNSRWFLPYIKH